jgi:F0F1-type ATP synthase assembly protein I
VSAPVVAAAGWRSPRKLFHAASYLQYPFMTVAGFYAIRPYFNGFDSIFGDFNLTLLYAGVAIGFSSLQDPTTTQNEVSRKVWEDPRKGSWAIGIIAATVVLAIGGGLAGLYVAAGSPWSQVAMGLVGLGLGMFGLLKTAIEMFENHRLDRNPSRATRTAQQGNDA